MVFANCFYDISYQSCAILILHTDFHKLLFNFFFIFYLFFIKHKHVHFRITVTYDFHRAAIQNFLRTSYAVIGFSLLLLLLLPMRNFIHLVSFSEHSADGYTQEVPAHSLSWRQMDDRNFFPGWVDIMPWIILHTVLASSCTQVDIEKWTEVCLQKRKNRKRIWRIISGLEQIVRI